MHHPRELLQEGALAPVVEVVQPEDWGKDDAQRREADGPHQREQVVEDGNGFVDDEGDRSQAKSETTKSRRHKCQSKSILSFLLWESRGRGVCNSQPNGPVYNAVGLQVHRVSKESNEDVFCCNVKVDNRASKQSGQGNAICNHLDGLSGAAQSRTGHPLSAPGVDDQTESEIAGVDHGLRCVDGLLVILGVPHL